MSDKIYDFDLETIAKLADIVKEKELGEITVSTGEKSITVKGRKCPPMPPMPPMGMPAPAGSAPAAAAKPVEEAKGNIITSPIVGTFYSSPAPEKPAYVKVGDSVNAGDVVCIIESMKLMNEINSEFSGKVAEILVNNGEPVEFGQKLMRIE